MIKSNYIVAENIISPLGTTAEENIRQIRNGVSGISKIEDPAYSPKPFYAAKIDREKMKDEFSHYQVPVTFAFLESLFALSIQKVIDQAKDLAIPEETILIISTTKGNIDQLGAKEPKNIYLNQLAEKINKWFDFPDKPLLISNACVSGVSAIILADRLIRSGKYKHAIVSGGDLLDKFIISGFDSFMAISDEPCTPYDKNRSGITLGEACGTVLITREENSQRFSNRYKIKGTGQSNDANHISGPSRDGKGLSIAIKKAMKNTKQVDVINAHGTATPFNDEMESKAFHSLGLDQVPLNSLKPYWGHTLGAAGIIETIGLAHELKEKIVVGNLGYKENGLSFPLNIAEENRPLERSKTGLKTISGFGGFNAALLLEA